MKFLVYIVLISLLSLLPQYVDACSVAWYSPGGYYMYRVYEEAGRQVPDAERDLLQNCLAWQQITSPDIPCFYKGDHLRVIGPEFFPGWF